MQINFTFVAVFALAWFCTATRFLQLTFATCRAVVGVTALKGMIIIYHMACLMACPFPQALSMPVNFVLSDSQSQLKGIESTYPNV